MVVKLLGSLGCRSPGWWFLGWCLALLGFGLLASGLLGVGSRHPAIPPDLSRREGLAVRERGPLSPKLLKLGQELCPHATANKNDGIFLV